MMKSSHAQKHDSPEASEAVAAPQIRQQSKGSSFRLPMYLLPKHKRDALFALYAVCRALDDAVDDAPSQAQALESLKLWEEDIARLFDGASPHHPSLQALAIAHQTIAFKREYFDDMLIALRMDAEGKMRYPTEAELERYCYGVASCVGLLSMQIFGCESEHAKPFAIALGQALQHTNILRDVITDAKIERIYLAKEWLEETECATMLPPSLIQKPEAMQPVYHKLSQKAFRYFQEAETHGKHLPARAIAPALAMRDVYACYWRALHAQKNIPPSDGKIALGSGCKTSLLGRMACYMSGKYLAVSLK